MLVCHLGKSDYARIVYLLFRKMATLRKGHAARRRIEPTELEVLNQAIKDEHTGYS
jgi:hypothetical protein